MDRNKKPIAVTRLQPELHTDVESCSTAAEPLRKDAFTSTEGYEELLNKRRLEEDRYHRLDDDIELRSRLLNKRLDEDLLHIQKEIIEHNNTQLLQKQERLLKKRSCIINFHNSYWKQRAKKTHIKLNDKKTNTSTGLQAVEGI